MHSDLLRIGLILNLMLLPALGSDAAPNFTSAANEKILLKIIHKIVFSAGDSMYFGGIDADSIKPEFGTSSVPQHRNGWRWSWTFKRHVHSVPNPDKGAQVATIPVVENDNGILFTIFIAYDHGDDLVSRGRTYVISDNPPLSIGYWMKTKQEDSNIKKTIEEAIMATVWIKKIE